MNELIETLKRHGLLDRATRIVSNDEIVELEPRRYEPVERGPALEPDEEATLYGSSG